MTAIRNKEGNRGDGMSLWEVSKALTDLLDGEVDQETGEIIEPDEADLQALKMTREDKIRGCIRYIKNVRANSKILGDAIKEMQSRKKVFDNKEKRTSDYLDIQTDSETDKGFGDEAGTLSWRKSTNVIIDDVDLLPIGYFDVSRQAVAKDIKAALSGGDKKLMEKFKGAAHLETGNSFKVK